jgi:cell division protein FtsB
MFSNLRKPLTLAGSFLLIGTLLAFFGFHTVAGERGLLARDHLDREILLATEQLALLQKQNAFLSRRIALLSAGTVDADMLAERARAELGLYSPRDVIISIDMTDLK